MAAQMSAQLQCTCNFDQKRLTFEAWQCKSVWMSAVQAISQAQPVAPAHGSGTRPSIIQGISCLEAQVCSDLLEQSTTAAGLLQLETSHACSTNAICQAAQGLGCGSQVQAPHISQACPYFPGSMMSADSFGVTFAQQPEQPLAHLR